MRRAALLLSLSAAMAVGQEDASRVFAEDIKPVLTKNCASCHNPAKARDHAPFLKAATVTEMEANRGLWRNVSAQLRNRTMPPVESKLTEDERLHIATWIDERLQQTACNVGEYAGSAVTRRLNRREYHNTIRDLLGIDFEVLGVLPADGTGGAGFDTNGETLFVPPILMERYMEAAQQILDRVIYTPPAAKTFTASSLQSGSELSGAVPAYLEGAYDVAVSLEPGETVSKLTLKVDGAEVGAFTQRRSPPKGPVMGGSQIHLPRGSHVITIVAKDSVVGAVHLTVQQKAEPPSAATRVSHHRLFGMEPGERPLQPRIAARRILDTILPKAFRRPVAPEEAERFMAMYDRSAERGDPYEERVKLALKAVLVWPEFLFRVEKKHTKPGIYPLSQHELATRLSYFLWSAPPDGMLSRLSGEGRLQDAKTLSAQVDRMLDDPRSRAFVGSFTGQWLGTQDIGGRVVPLITEIRSYYTPEIASDLRMQPILLLDRIVGENRSLLELLTADYTHMTQRLAKFYQIEDQVKGLDDSEFRLVSWPDSKRAGITGLAGVLAMTSRYRETSPVLRGAWALETLLGTPVPPPPPDVPPLKTEAKGAVKLSMRQKLDAHRASPACAGCHKLMDPIGFGLENFDWMGRWRDKDEDGKPVDANGELPSGEKFSGAVELRQVLLDRKQEFITNLAGRMLGYALGRSLQDGDSCTIQRIVQRLEKDNYSARTLIREIVLSTPFRNTQGGAVHAEPVISQRSLNISGLNAKKQDAASHNNQVKTDPAPK